MSTLDPFVVEVIRHGLSAAAEGHAADASQPCTCVTDWLLRYGPPMVDTLFTLQSQVREQVRGSCSLLLCDHIVGG